MQEAESELFARAQDLGDINRELQEAGEREHLVSLTLQRAMLPTVPPRVGGLEVAARYRPATEALSVGGDWYDAVELGPGRVALAVGDVVGRGLNAAAAMGQLRSALTAASYGVDGPAAALGVLDRFAATVEGALGATAAQVL